MNKNKEKKTTQMYLTQKENRAAEAVFTIFTAIGAVFVALWIFLYVGIGFLGFPVLIIGGAGLILLKSSKISDEDFEAEVKKIISKNGIEENNTTLKEYVVGKTEHIKKGNDKKIRTAFCSVAVFTFKDKKCIIKQNLVDLIDESVSSVEYTVPIGCPYELTEKKYSTNIGEVKRDFLNLNHDPCIMIPVNVNVYDTDAVIKIVTQKR